MLARIQQGWCQDQSPRWSRKGCEAVFLVHTCQRWTNLCNQWRRHSSASNMLLSDSFDIPKQIKHLLLFPTCVTYFIYFFLSLLQWFVVITMIEKTNTKSKQEEKCLNHKNLHHHKNWDRGVANHHFCSSVPEKTWRGSYIRINQKTSKFENPKTPRLILNL